MEVLFDTIKSEGSVHVLFNCKILSYQDDMQINQQMWQRKHKQLKIKINVKDK